MMAPFILRTTRSQSTFALSILAVAALGIGACSSKSDTPATSGGDITDQVYGSWTCNVAGQPEWKLEITKKNPNGTLQEWHDISAGGGPQNAYVHLTLLYLDDARDEPWRNFDYTTDPNAPDVLVALDEDDTSPLKYHCTKP